MASNHLRFCWSMCGAFLLRFQKSGDRNAQDCLFVRKPSGLPDDSYPARRGWSSPDDIHWLETPLLRINAHDVRLGPLSDVALNRPSRGTRETLCQGRAL